MDQIAEYQLEDARDALKHIISAVSQSRSQTRRLRWIAVRAQDGLDGTTEHQRVNLPKSAPNEIDNKIKLVKLKKDLAAAEARIAELEKALGHIRNTIDGDMDVTIRDLINGIGHPNDLYADRNKIAAIIDAALLKEDNQ